MRGLFSGVVFIGAGLLASVACNNLAFSQTSTGTKSAQSSQVKPNLTFKAESNGNYDVQDGYLSNLSDQVSLQGKDLKTLKSQVAAIQKKIDQNSRLISYLNSQLLQVQVGSKLSITEKPTPASVEAKIWAIRAFGKCLETAERILSSAISPPNVACNKLIWLEFGVISIFLQRVGVALKWVQLLLIKFLIFFSNEYSKIGSINTEPEIIDCNNTCKPANLV